jgi:hypothetical protein
MLTFQWMAGRFVLSSACMLQQNYQMDEQEVALYEQLHQERGLHKSIMILDKSEFQSFIIGYGSQMVFTDKINGKEVLFAIVPEQSPLMSGPVRLEAPEQETPNHQALPGLVFTKYTISGLQYPQKKAIAFCASAVFFVMDKTSLFESPIPTPPPEEPLSRFQTLLV